MANKYLLLRTLHALVVEHAKIKLEPCQKLLPLLAIFHNVLQVDSREVLKSY